MTSRRGPTVNTAGRADAMATGAELDVVAFLIDETEHVVADEDFVFYNAPVARMRFARVAAAQWTPAYA